MAELEVKNLWTLQLTTDELRLVLKGLGGRLVEDRDAKAAKDLGDVLTRLRGGQIKSSLITAERLLSLNPSLDEGDK